MLKGHDIILLLWLAGREGVPPTFSYMADRLHANPAAIHRSISRLGDAGLVGPDRNVPFGQADEFLAHGLRYLFPPVLRGESRGIPTAWAVPPLSDRLARVDVQPFVWAHPKGTVRGIVLEPIHRSVPALALADPGLHQRLALADALRVGDARIRGLAREELLKEFASAGGPR